MKNVFKLYKRTKIKKTLAIILICSYYSCASIYNADYKKPELVDKLASNSVKELHKKLHLIAEKGFAVGHQDATSYGIGWRHENNSTIIKSDVNEVAGDFPAVFGFDIGGIEHAYEYNLDSVPFNDMRKLIIDAYKKGGIITISWHADNPVSGGNAWDKTPAVADILIGGSQREKYELWIERVADFLHSLQYNGKNIPIIFRPFHEMNGSWFWWGEGNCEASDYIKLWQETVVLLRDNHNVHNVLYTYSPNKLNPNDNYLKYYSGDDYVDILGIDIYDFNNSEEYIKSMVHDLALVKSIASEKEKLFAFTETGLEKIPTEKWFSEVLYPNLENSGISWVLFWRNYKTTHHYMPYKGHSSEADFIKFEKLPKTLFLRDIKNIKN